MVKVAVLVDAENLPASHAKAIILEATRLGTVVERRLYGDFLRGNLKQWLEIAASQAFEICHVQSFGGKNSADIAIAVDAIELLCSSDIDLFCLATSDSDFAALAIRIRCRGKTVVAVGEGKALPVFREAVDRFVTLGLVTSPQEKKPAPPVEPKAIDTLPALLKAALNTIGGAGGWIDVGRLSQALKAVEPGFQPRAFGSATLSKLLGRCDAVELRTGADGCRQLRLKPVRKVIAA
ncbi:NYN domain-containing protein [Rhizobium sp. TRM95111]|uniref:NYN domain-containing protein n=1 Tax=Rhizobium alarense TaxID=2846851 RepID=UPI001F35EAFF|nr:NYN domain-containing protein [Rhizobium alarense]MCF3641931.1 NYN domain-containing protein [Rhizobium alarense]